MVRVALYLPHGRLCQEKVVHGNPCTKKMYTEANVQTKMYMTFPGLLFLEHFALNAQVAQARAPTALSETNPNTHVIH